MQDGVRWISALPKKLCPSVYGKKCSWHGVSQCHSLYSRYGSKHGIRCFYKNIAKSVYCSMISPWLGLQKCRKIALPCDICILKDIETQRVPMSFSWLYLFASAVAIFRSYVLLPPLPLSQIAHGKAESFPPCQCYLWRVALADSHGAADLLGNDNAAKVVDPSDNSGCFHLSKLLLYSINCT